MSQSEATIRHLVFLASPGQAQQEPIKRTPSLESEGAGAPFVIMVFVFLIAGFFWWFAGQDPKNSPSPVVGNEPGRQGVVDAEKLYLRERPSQRSTPKFILPRGTKVEAIGQHHQTIFGTIWVNVRVKTPEGLQEGWVDNKYVLRT